MPPSERGVGLTQALVLGALQGPAELLPISSSAHTTLLPWLADWPYGELAPELRKSFEVALHAGAAGALALQMRGELARSLRDIDARGLATIVLALAPPALAGYLFERPIERRLGGPGSIAAGLLAGSIAMALADARPGRLAGMHSNKRAQARRPRGLAGILSGERIRARRAAEQAGALDGLALGLAQVAALAPGVSRNGATLAAARALGFTRADAQTLSWHAGLPVMAGASALKAWRLARGGLPRSAGSDLLVGAGAAFLSTAASARLTRRGAGARSLRPYVVYRCALAAVTLRRLRRTQNRDG